MQPKKYLVAVSGGVDSMALLHSFKHQTVAVLHVNYQIRSNAYLDTKLVHRFCQQYNLPLHICYVNPKLHKHHPNNKQAYYRKIRYDFFYKMAVLYGVFICLVAHHRDDFLETVYLKQTRKGFYYGIKRFNIYRQHLQIYRPFLHKSKQSLIRYCQKHQITYREDETNQLDLYARNRVRKMLQTKFHPFCRLFLYFYYCSLNY